MLTRRLALRHGWQVGDMLRVPVRISSTSSRLQSTNILTLYDSGLLAVRNCVQEVKTSHEFECNFNGVDGEVRLPC